MKYDFKLINEIHDNESTITATAKKYCDIVGEEYNDSVRRRISKFINSTSLGTSEETFTNTETDTNQYFGERGFNAIGDDGKLMDLETYCDYYGLEFDKVKSWKLVSHTSIPYYNIAFHESSQQELFDEDEFKSLIREELDRLEWKPLTENKPKKKVGVVKIADLHLGAYVDNLIRTKTFSIDKLVKMLEESAKIINEREYSEVYIHILGDLIETFTGLNHKNSWKGLDKTMIGAEAVKLTVQVLHKNFLSRIKNLKDIKLVAGNHDRVTSDNTEDVHGGVANLIGWGLELIGYNVEFNALVITHTIGDICHILTHGHHSISKHPTQKLCWDYGEQGKFNLICEGHLHSMIDSMTPRQREKFKMIRDDAVDHRRITCPSFFSGNFYSESLGYTSQSGMLIVEDNGKGVPNVFHYCL